jgi:hypothetical protein
MTTAELTRRSYITTGPFFEAFYKYTTTLDNNYKVVGTLTPVTSDPSLCPRNRILRENGRKLFPGANPGVEIYMVGVYDAVSLLSGFIDPNFLLFAEYNADRPNYLEDPSIYTGSAFGRPVNTAGSITTGEYGSGPGYGYIQVAASNMAPNFANEGYPAYGAIYFSDHNSASSITIETAVSNGDGDYAGLYGRPITPYIETASYSSHGTGNYVGMYAQDGSIYYTGVLTPDFNNGHRSVGILTISGGNGTVSNPLLRNNPFVLLTRKGIASGTIGELTYDIGGPGNSTLTVHSTGNEVSQIVYFLVGDSD